MRACLCAAIAGLAIVLATSGSGGTAAEAVAPAYGMVSSMSGGAQTLVRVDPVTLKPLAGGLPIAKDLGFGGRSPDGRSAVFFDYRRPSLRVVDLEGLRSRGDVALAPAGWRARAAAWLTADRVAVVIQRMRGSYGQIVDRREVVLVDPLARRVLARREIAGAMALTASASGGDKLVLLLGRGDARTRTVRVAVVDSSGAVRTINVDLGAPKGLRLPSLVVERSGLRAFVIAAGAPAIEIDLTSLVATPHVITGGGAVLADSPLGSRQALLLDGGILAVTGHNSRQDRGVQISNPAGLAFVDTSTWQARLVDPDVSNASASADTLVGSSFRIERVQRDGRPAQKVVGIGLRAYAADGSRRWQRFGTQALTATAFRDSALVRRHPSPPIGWAESFVVDLDNGRQIGRNLNPRQNFWLLPDVAGARSIRGPAAAPAEALQVEGGGEEFRGTVEPEVTRVVAALVDGSERELPIEDGGVSYRAATPDESARTVQAFAGDQLVASLSLPVACGGSAGPCAPAAAPDAPPTYAFVGELPSGNATLVRVDPRTLAPIGRGLRLGESFAPSFARSPDGAEVALAVAGKPLVRIVELASLSTIRTLRVGGAGDEARTLAWLDDDRLAVVTQRMSRPTRRYVRERAVVTIDPSSGRVVARHPLTNKLAIGGVGIGADRLVLLLRSSSRKGSTVELAVVDSAGTVRTRGIEVGKTRGVLNATALAVEPSGNRAFLLGWAIQRTTPPVIEVDLDTLTTASRLVSVEHTGPLVPAMLSTLHVGPAGDAHVIAFGTVGAQGDGGGMLRPAAGIFVIDTRNWTARQLDPRASYFKVQEQRVITYGPSSAPPGAQPAQHGSGVSVYELPTRKLFHLYASRPFQRIELAGDYGHVLLGAERTKRLLFDASVGKPLGMLPAIVEPIQVLPAVTPRAKTRTPSSAAARILPAAIQPPTNPFSRVSNRGTRVKPKAAKPGEREMTPRDLFLLRQEQGRALYRIGGVTPGRGTCFGSGPGNDIGRLGGSVCGPDFPSRRNPLRNMSVMQIRRGEKNPQLYRLEGVAADAIVEIGLLDPAKEVVTRVPVRENVYVLTSPPAAATGELVAYDRRGQIVFRTGQPSPRAAPPPTHPRWLAGFRIKITLPHGWTGEIRRSGAGPSRALLLAGNRLPARDPRSVSLALTERDPRARPAFQRVAEPPQLGTADVRPVRSGQGRVERTFTYKGRQFTLQLGLGTSRPSGAQIEEVNRALATLYIGAIAVPPTVARAGAGLQRGTDKGVTVDVYRSGIVVFRFDRTSSLYRQLQGKQLSVACLTFDSVSPWEPNESWFSNRRLAETVQFIFSEATRPRPPYATVDPATEAKPPFDGCLVSGPYGRRWNDTRGTHSPAEIAFTRTGKRFFDERAVARDLALFIRSPKLAAVRRSQKQGGTAPAAAELTRGLPDRVVALAERSALPAAGEIGVWSNRSDTIEVSARSSDGQRLFIELRAGRIARHNLEGLAFVF